MTRRGVVEFLRRSLFKFPRRSSSFFPVGPCSGFPGLGWQEYAGGATVCDECEYTNELRPRMESRALHAQNNLVASGDHDFRGQVAMRRGGRQDGGYAVSVAVTHRAGCNIVPADPLIRVRVYRGQAYTHTHLHL